MDLRNATEIYDGVTWYFGLEPRSVEVDQDLGTVSFIVRWRATGRCPARRERVTLRLDQVKGVKEALPA